MDLFDAMFLFMFTHVIILIFCFFILLYFTWLLPFFNKRAFLIMWIVFDTYADDDEKKQKTLVLSDKIHFKVTRFQSNVNISVSIHSMDLIAMFSIVKWFSYVNIW